MSDLLIQGDNQAVREQTLAWKAQGESIAFVPTMGNLHAGHLSLVDKAKELADRVVVSIFVNPMQFGANEDFDTYPRTLEADAQKLEAMGKVDLLYTPTKQSLYPQGCEQHTHMDIPHLSNTLCGASRPDFLRGVCIVLTKLFHVVNPDAVIMGEKDRQQLLVTQKLAADLMPFIQIIGAPIVREADGLAMSSRNQYLSEAERALAPLVYQSLLDAKAAYESGVPIAEIEAQAQATLTEAGFAMDYFTIRRSDTLQAPETDSQGDFSLIAFVAAQLGETRLIDNLAINKIA